MIAPRCHAAAAHRSSAGTRRSFLASLGTAALATPLLAAEDRASRPIPVGLQMYSVRGEEKRDLLATLRAVRGMGYDCVEFWAPYAAWTPERAREVRRQLDDLGLRCHSNHTAAADFAAPALPRIVELNHILGSRRVIMAHAGPQPDLDGWRRTAAVLARASAALGSEGLSVGYHNWDVDFRPVDGVRPVDILTGNTPREVFFELDVATCLAAGADPIAFVRANAGRIRTYHLKDWSSDPQKQYRVLLGEGIGRWKELLDVAETVGGVEYYLIEQEGSRFSELETARRCLENLQAIRG
ncbi:MAG: sugar phosphate isomerase/epimerase [Verrucomicrobia bacterium]|nr:sugar phosphate isomerase/epimerase [Verrucomicrobiota bacterium]